MDSSTHTHMSGLVQRAAASGSLGQRSSYYTSDGSNAPPQSPTAKWKGEVHAYEEPPKDSSRFPYLPHPYPLTRRGRAQTGHPGGFVSLQAPLQPPKFPEQDQLYMTYAEWWQAQQPPPNLKNDKEAMFSTSFWPYGRRISCVASMDKEDQFYNLDKRVIRNHTHYKDRRDPLSSSSFSRSRSSAELLGSQAEHFGYNKSLGQSMSSHASASFHEQNHLPPGQPYAASSGKRGTMWDSMKASAGAPTSGLRANSVPSTSRSQTRSIEAQAGSTRNFAKQSSRDLGLGVRINAEWCLPQPPGYSNS